MTTSRTAATAAPSTWLTWEVVPRGVSEIFFQSNTWTGLLILAAFVVADWQMALLALIGAICSTLAGVLMRVKTDDITMGMAGFNGTLVGAALFVELGGGKVWTYVLTVVGALVCGPVTWFFNWLFATPALSRFGLPSTTAPFCSVTGVIYVLTTSLHVESSSHHAFDESAGSLLRSLLTNVSEVVLINNVWSGALILVGLFVASWKVGLAAAMGSVIGTLCALAMGESAETIVEGLAGYSGVLTAIALSVVFLRSTVGSWIYAAVGAAITAVVTVAMTDAYGGPHFTWPYILTTWVLLVIATFIPALKRP
ncbi:urea transporter [Nocardioides sp. zg-1228]|uniref:urea transporter n=1 Tax=Nocardioides sp. zg-1228 TaxID=2763008 RepID=UPI001642F106|nr:urea transporter [Nocardioides sp. zg-1228]MBC2933081.1 urea transporter [Nocardioides sp. zg-1228]QSF56729.1 urea transporter [Nocardioides sp. zg-1228]